MTRLSLFGLLAAGLTLLAGCPIYDDNPNQNCENCGTGGGTTTSTANGQCFTQADCTGVNETCGSDGYCHTGDCVSWGCVNGEMCSVGADQKAHCGAGGAGGAGGASMGGAGGTGGAGGAIIAGGAGGTGGAGGATGGSGGAGGATGGAGGATGGAGGAAQGGAAQGGAPAGGAGGAPAGGTGGTGGM